MDKLDPKQDGASPDIVQENIDKLCELFPDAFAEGSDRDGSRWKVDFDALRQILGDYVENERERYSFSWHGKARARQIAQTPSVGTLRPCPGESVNWDTTQNLFIEGDNLEVLKLLQKSYHKQVKMIYIDPPYNTGGEFIYPDRFQDNLDTYLRYTGQIDDQGFKVSANSESSGRYHTKWLNMMYPRLRLARTLLRDDGLIFISIDDHEVANLRHICNEIFGEENFVTQFVWNTEGHTDNQYDVKVNHEYVVLYTKSDEASVGHVVDPNVRAESNLWRGYAENSITKNGSGNPPSEITLPAGFPCACEAIELPPNCPDKTFFERVSEVGHITRSLTREFSASYPIRKDRMNVGDNKLMHPCRVYSGWANAEKLKKFIKSGCKPIIEEDGSEIIFYLSGRGVVYYRRKREKARNVLSVLRSMGTTEQMRSELERMGVPFQYPKPKQLLSYLLDLGAQDGGLILDFFSGSCTTAHAIIERNVSADNDLSFIMVQLPEPIDPRDGNRKPIYDFCVECGIPANIAEIGKERLRRVMADTNRETGYDLGFKVFKLNASNIRPWEPSDEDLKGSLFDAVENIEPDRTERDVLYELLLKYGLDLAVPIEEREVASKTVFVIGAGALIVCLADDIKLDVVNGIAVLKDELTPEVMRVVFKDAGFADDVVKTNTVQILSQAGVEDVKSL